jgi:hypothetical protein
MVNTVLHFFQLIFEYICRVTTVMLDKLTRAVLYCQEVCGVLRIDE